MKLALIGSSPIALEAALRFHAHEAAWTWFNADEIELEGLFTTASLSWEDCTTELGWKTLKEIGGTASKNDQFSWEKWKGHYYRPLMEHLKSMQSVKPYKVLAVTKRFLALDEEVQGQSRFTDLFRLIYQLNPEEFINQHKESNPETYERLSSEFMQSLQSSLEMYEDFDLVMDFRRPDKARSISVTGRALGEDRVGHEHLRTGVEVLNYRPGAEVREIALVGSMDMAAHVLIKLSDWLKDPRHRVFVASHEENPFSKVLSDAREEIRRDLQVVFARMDKDFEAETTEFHQKLREWQQLDDFIQVKKPKPVEPIPRLVFFSGHNVTAIDQLIDKRRVFVTLEKPEWRRGEKQPENNQLELKTIGVDEVLVANGLTPSTIAVDLRADEIGYYRHTPVGPLWKGAYKEDLNALAVIEEKIFKLFSPAHPS